MIQVWCYDENGIFTESIFVEEVTENMTVVPPNGLGLYCKKWNGSEWIEGWTEEEIQQWKDENTVVPQQPTLEDKIITLEVENEQLKKRLEYTEDALIELSISTPKGG